MCVGGKELQCLRVFLWSLPACLRLYPLQLVKADPKCLLDTATFRARAFQNATIPIGHSTRVFFKTAAPNMGSTFQSADTDSVDSEAPDSESRVTFRGLGKEQAAS